MITCPKCRAYIDGECFCVPDTARQLQRYLQLVADSMLSLPRYMIPTPDGEPYLERLVLEDNKDSNGKTINKTYLHIIYASDGDRDPHDHPFDFESKIIFGSYLEHNYDRQCPKCAIIWTGDVVDCRECKTPLAPFASYKPREYGPGAVNFKRAHNLHRLEVIQGPVVTLVKRGPKIRDWGFQTQQGWESHATYLPRKFPSAEPTEIDV